MINFEIWKMHAQFSIVPRNPCAIILINPKCTCLYLLLGFNVYFGSLVQLVQIDGATSISTVSLVDVEVGSFSPYIFVPTHWVKHTKTTIWGAPSLGNLSCSKLYFSPLSLAVVVATVTLLSFRFCPSIRAPPHATIASSLLEHPSHAMRSELPQRCLTPEKVIVLVSNGSRASLPACEEDPVLHMHVQVSD